MSTQDPEQMIERHANMQMKAALNPASFVPQGNTENYNDIVATVPAPYAIDIQEQLSPAQTPFPAKSHSLPAVSSRIILCYERYELSTDGAQL